MAYISKPSKFRKAAFMSTLQLFGTLKKLRLIYPRDLFESDPRSITGIRKYAEAYTFEYNDKIYSSHYRLVAHHMVNIVRMMHKLKLRHHWPQTLRQTNFMSKYYKRWR